uniref:De Novo Protein sr322 n=1 Tax=unidentified TaxID=32644 RepID=UPI003510D26C
SGTVTFDITNISHKAIDIILKVVLGIAEHEGTEVTFHSERGQLQIEVKNLHEEDKRLIEQAIEAARLADSPDPESVARAVELLTKVAKASTNTELIQFIVKELLELARKLTDPKDLAKVLDSISELLTELALKTGDPTAALAAMVAHIAELVVRLALMAERTHPGSEIVKKAVKLVQEVAEEVLEAAQLMLEKPNSDEVAKKLEEVAKKAIEACIELQQILEAWAKERGDQDLLREVREHKLQILTIAVAYKAAQMGVTVLKHTHGWVVFLVILGLHKQQAEQLLRFVHRVAHALGVTLSITFSGDIVVIAVTVGASEEEKKEVRKIVKEIAKQLRHAETEEEAKEIVQRVIEEWQEEGGSG